ncbi:vanin-like protein 1 [Anopheles cruzii]|uniref:vanin-like protein 1 n=1 Tax=Anopheles cruzii TaxID=68878 RepID=UPI0022EC8A82|nr:vanin-like protein 1 [Anopheles cruzii]
MNHSVWCLFCISLFLLSPPTEQVSTASDPHYWAGVVEFSSQPIEGESDIAATERRLAKYLEIIASPDAVPADVLAFPENTLDTRSTASFVPHPADRIIPCNNLRYEKTVRDVSCEAQRTKKYVLINLTEKARCPEGGDTRPCGPDGHYHFNTNVAFDRDGMVVSRYRKFHLFGEAGMNTTVFPEIASFETDFGVTFGHFICFDMMFNQPALDLVALRVTDFIFPTMWFSELPFLTASQIQQGWALSNNVNLLAAGASWPAVGSTGTGIYSGKRGTITTVMNHEADTKLYIAQVPKIQFPETPVSKLPQHSGTPSQMAKLRLKRDHIDGYKTSDLPMVSNAAYEKSVCYDSTSFCCSFTINYTVKEMLPSQNHYRYKLVAYDAERTFDGFADGEITTCAILACSSDNYADCSQRFGEGQSYEDSVTFNAISISAKFANNYETFVLPTSVDTSIMPLDVTETEYTVVPSATDNEPHNMITYKLIRPRSDLLSFAIWSRKFDYRASGAPLPGVVPSLVLLAALWGVMRNVCRF